MLNSLSVTTRLLSRCRLSVATRTFTFDQVYHSRNRMDRAMVRCVPGEPKLTISFVLDGSHRHMLRDKDEELGRVLCRIANNAVKGQAKAKAKKHKKNTGQQSSEAAEGLPAVSLFMNGEAVAESALNTDAWQDGTELHIGDIKYAVQRNAPTFTTAELPSSLLASFPVCPKLEVEFGRLEDCQYTWFKQNSSDSDPPVEEGAWTEAGNGRVYIPTNQDIGRRLKLRCTPKDGARSGPPKEVVSTATVEAGPGVCTFDNRHMYTLKGTDERMVRVVSYNVLADIYAQTELSRTVLYPYCPPYALQASYRLNLLRKELAGYNADIICLQEVDKGVFSDSLAPALDAFGLDGDFQVKDRQHEGLAIFYRRSKMKLLSRHDIILSKALTSDPIHSELLHSVSGNSGLKEKVLKRSTALQVSVFEDLTEPNRKLCVANTHLYWHPKGGNVRLVQLAVALQHLSHVIREAAPGALLLFSGDFNSIPSSAVFQLLTQGQVSETHPDWSSDDQEEALSLCLSSPFPALLSACGEPAYTNYVGGFHGCLDYIFLQPGRMEVEQVIPLPSHQEVTTHQALPSVAHPSDHIALICDLRWTDDL